VLLKKAVRRDLPPSIVARTKQPYRSPDSACFFHGGEPLPYVADLLDRPALVRAGLFDPTAVGKLVEKCRAGRAHRLRRQHRLRRHPVDDAAARADGPAGRRRGCRVMNHAHCI
jgi:asparagine synthetase B (glutamine-hydrolysing)